MAVWQPHLLQPPFSFRPLFLCEGLVDCVFVGCGAFSCVYRCVWRGGVVAVKVPAQFRRDFEEGRPYRFTQAPEAVQREVEAAKSLSHRNVLRLVEALPGYGVLIYEWGDGGSLRAQRLSGGDVLKAFVQVAWGLRYLHSRGVVHGDLKPENVIVSKGLCKIADLSSVRRLLSYSSGRGACTPGFCAPEQRFSDLAVESRARGFEDRRDVYQLANLTLSLLGAEAVDGEEWSPERVERAAQAAEEVGLGRLIRQMLSREPWRRPSAEEAAKRAADVWRRLYS